MAVLPTDAFRDQPILTGDLVRLEPAGPEHADGLLAGLDDPEVARLTGSTATIDEQVARRWYATRRDHHDRADWAIVRRDDGAVVGEAVLNSFEPENASVNFRIMLVGRHEFGRGYGTEATRLVLDHAFDGVGLHRVSLEVFDFNPRARRVYEKCGFTVEGVLRDALRWDGRWHDAIVMAVLATDRRPRAAATGAEAAGR